ncbi:permease [Geobacillus thermoleovorans]
MQSLLTKRHPLFGALVAVAFAFCSCSTIPVVVSLLNQKVRFGIVMIFLFDSPVLDPIILTLMAATLGVKVAISYTIITTILSILIGFTLEKLGFENQVKQVMVKGEVEIGKKRNMREALQETFHLIKTVYPYLLLGAGIEAIIHGAVLTEWISTYMGG